ncbi:MAG: class I SAM-dependent methyltransferase, partial [Candidatus Omnitrophica bacterium]|nr:class I SAM-dependent methyltransferase [Candidatus Omnitrophota bacterium]
DNFACLLRSWRDQIIRDLASRERLSEAREYTRFLDEVVSHKKIPDWKKKLLVSMDRFLEGIYRLDRKGQLTEQNILKLIAPSTSADPTYAVLAPGPIRADLLMPHTESLLAGSWFYWSKPSQGDRRFSGRGTEDEAHRDPGREEMIRTQIRSESREGRAGEAERYRRAFRDLSTEAIFLLEILAKSGRRERLSGIQKEMLRIQTAVETVRDQILPAFRWYDAKLQKEIIQGLNRALEQMKVDSLRGAVQSLTQVTAQLGKEYRRLADEAYQRVLQYPAKRGKVRHEPVVKGGRQIVMEQGGYAQSESEEGETGPVAGEKPYITLWEAIWSCYDTLSDEFDYYDQARSFIDRIGVIQSKLQVGQTLNAADYEHVKIQVADELSSLVQTIHPRWVVEKKLSQRAVHAAMSLVESDDWESAFHALGLAGDLYRVRWQEVGFTIGGIFRGRLAELLEDVASRNQRLAWHITEMKQAVSAGDKTRFQNHNYGMRRNLENERFVFRSEPDLENLRSLVFGAWSAHVKMQTAQAQRKNDEASQAQAQLESFLERAQRQIEISNRIHWFLRIYFSEMKKIRRQMPMDPAAARGQSFRQAYALFLEHFGIIRGSPADRFRADWWLLKLYQAACIHFKIEGGKTGSRILNPVFQNFQKFLQRLTGILSINDIAKVLQEPSLVSGKKTANLYSLLVRIVQTHTTLFSLDDYQRDGLIDSLARDFEIPPTEIAKARSSGGVTVGAGLSESSNQPQPGTVSKASGVPRVIGDLEKRRPSGNEPGASARSETRPSLNMDKRKERQPATQTAGKPAEDVPRAEAQGGKLPIAVSPAVMEESEDHSELEKYQREIERKMDWLFKEAGVVRESRVTRVGRHTPLDAWRAHRSIDLMQIPAEGIVTVLDAGSGQGDYAIRLALRHPNARVIGIEYDERFFEDSRKILQKAIDVNWIKEGQVQLLQGDYNEAAFAPYFQKADIVYYYVHGTFDTRKLAATLRSHLRIGVRVLQVGYGSDLENDLNAPGPADFRRFEPEGPSHPWFQTFIRSAPETSWNFLSEVQGQQMTQYELRSTTEQALAKDAEAIHHSSFAIRHLSGRSEARMPKLAFGQLRTRGRPRDRSGLGFAGGVSTVKERNYADLLAKRFENRGLSRSERMDLAHAVSRIREDSLRLRADYFFLQRDQERILSYRTFGVARFLKLIRREKEKYQAKKNSIGKPMFSGRQIRKLLFQRMIPLDWIEKIMADQVSKTLAVRIVCVYADPIKHWRRKLRPVRDVLVQSGLATGMANYLVTRWIDPQKQWTQAKRLRSQLMRDGVPPYQAIRFSVTRRSALKKWQEDLKPVRDDLVKMGIKKGDAAGIVFSWSNPRKVWVRKQKQMQSLMKMGCQQHRALRIVLRYKDPLDKWRHELKPIRDRLVLMGAKPGTADTLVTTWTNAKARLKAIQQTEPLLQRELNIASGKIRTYLMKRSYAKLAAWLKNEHGQSQRSIERLLVPLKQYEE